MRKLVGENVRKIRTEKGLEQGRRNPTVVTLHELAKIEALFSQIEKFLPFWLGLDFHMVELPQDGRS